MDTIELLALEDAQPGYMLVHVIDEHGEDQMMIYRPPLQMTHPIGVAARRIRQGEKIQYCPDENTPDIIVKTERAQLLIYMPPPDAPTYLK